MFRFLMFEIAEPFLISYAKKKHAGPCFHVEMQVLWFRSLQPLFECKWNAGLFQTVVQVCILKKRSCRFEFWKRSCMQASNLNLQMQRNADCNLKMHVDLNVFGFRFLIVWCRFAILRKRSFECKVYASLKCADLNLGCENEVLVIFFY
jgi:hypothetical protein